MGDPLVEWARLYVGIPFRTGGRERAGGLDCFGLVRLVFAERFGRVLPSRAEGYADIERDRKAICADLEAHRARLFREVVAGDARAAEGVAVLLREGGLPLHTAIYAGREGGHPYILHTTKDRGHSHLERLTSVDFRHSDPRFFRLMETTA